MASINELTVLSNIESCQTILTHLNTKQIDALPESDAKKINNFRFGIGYFRYRVMF